MINANKKQHILGFIMLSMTAIFWGAGFVLNDQLLTSSFQNTPNLLNAVRFVVSAIALLAIFAKRLKFNKHSLLYGLAGGAMLFVGFTLQLIGLKYTTPSHNGFFTAAYIVFVPFIAWIIYKKRPVWTMFAGVTVAIAGLLILNLFGQNDQIEETTLGDILTLVGSLMFAMQIAWSDFALKKQKIDHINLTFWQVFFAAVLFALYTLIFESKNYKSMQFDVSYDLWRLAIVSLCGTAFAYFSQSYAQNKLNPTETAIILACESPIGAVISIAAGIELFYWNTLVGGLLVIASVILMEIVPVIINKKKEKQANKAVDEISAENKEDNDSD